jgi:hypothetical protein
MVICDENPNFPGSLFGHCAGSFGHRLVIERQNVAFNPGKRVFEAAKALRYPKAVSRSQTVVSDRVATHSEGPPPVAPVVVSPTLNKRRTDLIKGDFMDIS